jgi:hypothetical protein
VRFTAVLPMRNFGALEARLLEISDPAHADYGRWMSREAVAALTAADETSRAIVREWLRGMQCQDLPHALACLGEVRHMEALLGVPLHAFRARGGLAADATAAAGGGRLLRVRPGDNARIKPAPHLRGHLLFLTGLNDFPSASRRLGRVTPFRAPGAHPHPLARTLTGGGDGMAPGTIHALGGDGRALGSLETLWNVYNFHANVRGRSDVAQAAAEFESVSVYSQSDVDALARQSGVDPWGTDKFVGPQLRGGDVVQQTLDVGHLGAVGRGNANW